MRRQFDQQLALLNRELIEMGALCEEVIALASKALTEGNPDMAARVAPLDTEIDQKERTIESLCLKLLLQQQPVARDLRQISAALKMITDMERIGDQAQDIAEIVTFLKGRTAEHDDILCQMARATISMVTESVDAFVKHDTIKAEAVLAADDTVDAYFRQVKQALISRIAADPGDGEYALDLLMIAKYFERIGDHATNIMEIGAARRKEKSRFSAKAEHEIENLSGIVTEMLEKSVRIVDKQLDDPDDLNEVFDRESHVDELCETLAAHHVDRVKNKKCTPKNGMLYLDMLNNLERIADHANNLAESVDHKGDPDRLLW